VRAKAQYVGILAPPVFKTAPPVFQTAGFDKKLVSLQLMRHCSMIMGD